MKRIFRIVLLSLVLAALAPASAPARAARSLLPAGFTRTRLGEGMTAPTAIAFQGNRIYVTEKGGAIRIIRPNGELRSKPFHILSVSQESERGLLGIAFDPNFATNRSLYVYYTTGGNAKRYSGTPENRVSRLKRRKNNPGFKERIILDHIPSTNGNHNGGDIHFGFDGKLYVSVGESGCCPEDAQGLDTLRGKILRINPDGSIPTDNPFYNTPNARRETFAYGLRNPWRIAKRAANQSFIVSDVGSADWEEVNSLVKGHNYGWPLFEGPCPRSMLDCDPAMTDFGSTDKPIHWYNHATGDETGNVIAGGVFAENSNYPEPYANAYIYGDTAGDWVHVLKLNNQNEVESRHDFDVVNSPVAFGNGPDGNIYVVSHYSGLVFKYAFTP